MKDFLTIGELSEYLNVKRSTLYSMVESGELPHYRIGRLIRFKRSEMDRWVESNRREYVNMHSDPGRILKAANRGNLNIRNILKKSIAGVEGNRYTPNHGRPDRVKGLRKEVKDGTL